jgi:hypothetical protein
VLDPAHQPASSWHTGSTGAETGRLSRIGHRPLPEPFCPVAVAVDSSHIYWADGGSGTIMEANLDGSNPLPLVSGQNDPAGVAVGPQ